MKKVLSSVALAASLAFSAVASANDMRQTNSEMFACETLEQMATSFKVLTMKNDDRRNYYMKVILSEYGEVCYPLYDGLEFAVIDAVPPFIYIEVWSESGEPHYLWSVEPSFSKNIYQVDFDNWYGE